MHILFLQGEYNRNLQVALQGVQMHDKLELIWALSQSAKDILQVVEMLPEVRVHSVSLSTVSHAWHTRDIFLAMQGQRNQYQRQNSRYVQRGV